MLSANLLITIVLLSLLLVTLVFFYINSRKKNGEQKKRHSATSSQTSRKSIPPTFEQLKAIIKNRQTSTQELENAVTQIMQYYGEIPPKRGVSPDKMFTEYAGLLIAVCRHKNTNAQIVVHFDSQLRKKNPSYESNIDEMLQQGLNSRS